MRSTTKTGDGIMNWRREAANDLMNYSRRKESLENMREQMAALKAQFGAIKSSSNDSTPVMGGGESRYEDRLLNNIVKRERLGLTYQATKRLVNVVEKGLSSLSEQERHVIDRFYINRTKDYIERLMSEMGYERSRVYQIKDDALYKFTICMYGLTDY